MHSRHDMIAVYIARRAGKTWEFLQLRRRDDDYLGGTWSTVYGMMEPGETAWQAALRELREEAGLTPAEFYRVPTVRSFYTSVNDTLWQVPAFAAIVPADARVSLNDEHTAARWVRLDHTGRAFMWPTDRAAIGEIAEHILSEHAEARLHLRVALP